MARETSDPHDKDGHDAPMDSALAWRLLKYSLPYRKWIFTAIVLVLVVTALDLAGPLIVRHAIDGPLTTTLLSTGSTQESGDVISPEQKEDALHYLYQLMLIYLVVIVLYSLIRYGQNMLMSVIGKTIMNNVRMETFIHLQKLPMAFFDRNPVGRLVTRISNDVEALNQLFTSGVVIFLADLLVLVGIAIILFFVNTGLALLTLSVVPFILLVTFIFRYFARKYYREQRTHLSNLNGFTQEALQGMDIIHLFVREKDNYNRFSIINEKYLTTFLKTTLCYSFYFPALEILGTLTHVGILLWGGHLIVTGEISFGDFYLFWIYLNKFFGPIRDMAERYNILQSAMTASERIFGVLDEPVTISNPEKAIQPASIRGEVEFQNVSFAYNETDYAIRNLDFQVSSGETIAIVGATGAGKSTVVNLLSRFYDPQSGRILVDGMDVKEYDQHILRERIALVLQDPFLFTTSILENIRLGNHTISEEMAIQAACRVRANTFIEKLPGGYHEEMQERGATLSVGERQLLSFARSLAHNPDLLILDEATSNIDTETEKLIQTALNELLRGRTSIVIAHRLSTIQKANRILVLHKGELREQGNHRELLAKRGIYYRLYELQFAGDRK